MKNVLSDILNHAVDAPSGENCQPWRFNIEDNKIYVFNIPERDQSPYNFKQRGSLVSHGALIENILIISSAWGFDAKLSLFPEKDKTDLVAIISLNRSTPKQEPLYVYINKRSTNRKAYKKLSLTKQQKQELLNSVNQVGGGKALFIEDEESIKLLSLVGAMNERLVLENKILHNFLFTHINWTEEENEKNKIGFYIKTLELSPPAQFAFRLFSRWSVLNFLNKKGRVSKSVWQQNAKVYASSAAIGVIAVNDNENEDFITAGRITQRIWLTATKLGLSVQPMTGVLFFAQRVMAGDLEFFPQEQLELIKESYDKIKKIFNLKNETVPMMFRIGQSDPPTAKALKLKPDITWI